MSGKRALPLLGLLVLVAAVAALALARRASDTDNPTTHGSGAVLGAAHTTIGPRVAMGGHLFVQFACAACHGPQGGGGISPDVPALKKAGNTLTVAQLSR